MATGDYTTSAKVKALLWPDGSTPDSTNDTQIASLIAAASRAIDHHCGTRFYSTATDETRYYTPDRSDRLRVGPLISVTSVASDVDGDRTYETAWAATDWELYPYNAALDGLPYTEIRATPLGSYGFPAGGSKSVKVVGKFGWAAATPSLIEEACNLLCVRWFNRPNAPFGSLGPGAFGGVSALPVDDPDVVKMLAAYRCNYL